MTIDRALTVFAILLLLVVNLRMSLIHRAAVRERQKP